MNRNFLLPFLVLICIGSVNAQSIVTGLKADVNLFRIDGDGMTSQFHPGVSGGFFAIWKLNKQWSIQPELLYSQRNTKAKDFSKFYSGSVSLTASNDIFLSYASVPLQVNYQLTKQLSISAGGQYNYLVHADENLLKDNKEAFAKNDIGIIGGLGYSVSKRLGFYGRFYYGLNDISNINTLHTWKTRQLQIGISYAVFGVH